MPTLICVTQWLQLLHNLPELNSLTPYICHHDVSKKQARKGFRPISASEVLLVRKVNNLINKRMEHWSCRIFVQQVK